MPRRHYFTPLEDLNLTPRDIVVSLVATQILVLGLVFIILFLYYGPAQVLFRLQEAGWTPASGNAFFWTLAVFAALFLFEWLIALFVPPRYLYDPLNALLFKQLPWPVLSGCFILGAFCEEVLFRGVLQNIWGLGVATTLFVLIHVRYLRRGVLLLEVVILGLGLGMLYNTTGTLWAPILCHFALNIGTMFLVRRGILSYENPKK